MDNLIIEHLACLEINRIILQEPYHLVSDVKFNDKSPGFDGEIFIYNSDKLTKEHLLGSVRIQIKGTTVNKKVKNKRIKFLVKKNDLEVYKKFGVGVLFFVVLVNNNTKKRQAYYNALTPLDVERVLNIIEENENESISIDFKLLQDRALNQICKIHLNNVEKQPIHFIELSKNREFNKYKIQYTIPSTEVEEFSFFDDVGYIYGVDRELELPVEAIVAEKLLIDQDELLVINGENINVRYHVTDSKSETSIEIENTVNFLFSKDKKTASFKMKKLKSINSYIKVLKIIKYILEHKKLPLELYNIVASINEIDKFEKINDEIQRYQEILRICERIGISGDYEFDENENLDSLFLTIYKIFEEQKYELINIESDAKDEFFLRLKLSDNITLFLFKNKTDNMYYSIFDEIAIQKIVAVVPKNPEVINPSVVDSYKASIYSNYNLQEELLHLTNFNFETYKKSFEETNHYRGLEINNQIVLDLISVYDNSGKIEYLELAMELIEGLIESHQLNDIFKLNLIQIKKRLNKSIDSQDETYLYDLLCNSDNQQMIFVIYVILGIKPQANRIFEKLDIEQRMEITKWPIYNLYTKL